jgi:hypothetical protein
MTAIKILALDLATFIWAVIIWGEEVPQPQQRKPRRVTWAQSLAEIQAI